MPDDTIAEKISVAIEANMAALIKELATSIDLTEEELKRLEKTAKRAFGKTGDSAERAAQEAKELEEALKIASASGKVNIKKLDDEAVKLQKSLALLKSSGKFEIDLDTTAEEAARTAEEARQLQEALRIAGASGKFDIKELDDEALKLERSLSLLRKSGKFEIEGAKETPSLFKRITESIKASWLQITAMIGALAGLVAGIKRLTDESIALDKQLSNVSISANAASREFGASVGSAESWQQAVKDLRKELRVFATEDVAQASTRLIDMTKRLGLTETEMQMVLRRTADLAAGKVDLTGAIERTTAALRGEAESAEFLGLSLNETQVKAYAEAQGLIWKDLSDTEKARQRYELFLQQTNALQGRAAQFAGTRAGKEAELNAKLRDQAAILGEQLLPLRDGYNQLLLGLTGETEESASLVSKALAAIAASYVAFGATAKAVIDAQIEKFSAYIGIIGAAWDAVQAGENPLNAVNNQLVIAANAINKNVNVVASYGDTWQSAFDQILDGWQTQRDQQRQFDNDTPFVPPPEIIEEAGDEVTEALADLGNELIDLQEETNEEIEQLEIDHQAALAEIETEGAEKRLEINEKFDKELADKQAEILEGARQDLAELQEDTDADLAKRREEFNRDEFRETEDHLTDMRRLRLEYLDNLEDAVKNRDARAIVDLRRNFERESQEREDDFSNRQSREREDQNADLAEIRANEEKRAQEIIDKRSQALLEVEAKNEESRQRELTRLDETLAEQTDRENANFEERLTGLQGALAARLEEIAKELAAEDEIQREGAETILGTLAEYFGEGGRIDELMAAFEKRRSRVVEITTKFSESGTTTSDTAAQNRALAASGPQFSFQHGGTLIARRPTLVQFGEAGPEMAQFIPLSQMQHSMASQQEQTMNLNLNLSGSAPPGIRSADRDAIAGTLVQALRDAGVMK